MFKHILNNHKYKFLAAAVGVTATETYNSGNKELLSILPKNDIEQKLTKLQHSYSFLGKVKRVDINQLPSNSPIEDCHIESIINNDAPNSNYNDKIMLFGVMDGHSGGHTSNFLQQNLVAKVISKLYPYFNSSDKVEDLDYFNETLKKSFIELDNQIVLEGFNKLLKSPTRETLFNSTMPAISGSCCLLTIFNTNNDILTVAQTGDSRAILVSKESEYEYSVRQLSKDLTGDNPEEIARIKNLHPNEDSAVFRGRVLGSLQPSRAFGDYRYKIDLSKHQNLLPPDVKMFLRRPPKNLLTPPYVTAEPDVHNFKIDLKKDKYMIIASDGLFELLNNDDIARLVAHWENANIKNPDELKINVVNEPIKQDTFKYDQRYKQGLPCIKKDENLATHLIRNALSFGGQEEFVDLMCSLKEPGSRKYRDDLTVQVIFFNDTK
ncbi:hypothetical protein ACO0OL_003525 [Hanseniaspora opuntiae]